MNIFLEGLQKDFRDKIVTVLRECKDDGVILRPFSGARDAYVQARLWRQSRTIEQIKDASNYMKNQGAEWLAEVLLSVGPQYGRWATNSLPGISWHNHRLAIDSFRLIGKSAVWNSKDEGYRIYARKSVTAGLTSGYYWRQKDAVHVQGRPGKVLDKYNWTELDKVMQDFDEKREK